MLLQMAIFHSFQRLINISLYICTTYSLSNRLLMDSLFTCLGYCKVLQLILWCIQLFKLWFSPYRCPGVGLLNHMVVLYLVQVFFFFQLLHLWHMEVPRPGTESEPQLQPMPQLERRWIFSPTAPGQGLNFATVMNSHCSRILNPLCHSRNCYIQFFKEPQYCSPQQLYQFTFPPTVQEDSLFSTGWWGFKYDFKFLFYVSIL